MADLANVLAKKDYPRGAQLASEFDNSSIQHIVDEENVLLKLFIDAYGEKRADDAIKVFQQHRTMHKLADTISKTALTSPEDLGSMPSDLDKLVRSHFGAEEKRIFPWALKTQQEIRNKYPKRSTQSGKNSSESNSVFVFRLMRVGGSRGVIRCLVAQYIRPSTYRTGCPHLGQVCVDI